ncbi:hypothetical protein CMUS01_03825 [Colletotrichum musicola]|uniref:Uncharacterized protein n=1 Tax=Colletotrichum musicola TaxID=2175873 RepID=A0A8H6NQL9_9PEZI|nr:hypothetical protein CMUS01_03825 [Colletotrichum musicola]
MKSATSLLPLLATAASGIAIPQAPAPAELLAADAFTLDDVLVDPHVNVVPSVQGQDPEAFLNEDLAALDLQAGAEAWAAIVAEFSNFTSGGDPNGGPAAQQIQDYHYGITAQAICGYFRGIAYKTRELRRPTEQWQQENVPWLIYNKGPYIDVLDGIRLIDDVLWKIARGLQYTSVFTRDEERWIARCYYEWSGYEQQITTLPPVTGPIVVPGPVFGPGDDLDDDDIDGVTTLPIPTNPGTGLNGRQVATDDDGNTYVYPPYTGYPGPIRGPVTIPLRRRFNFKNLIRLIGSKAPISRYQSYANHRIANVLYNLENTVYNLGQGMLRKISNDQIREFLLFDLSASQGLAQTIKTAQILYENNP